MNNNFTLGNLQSLLFFPFTEPGGRNKLLVASLLGLASFFIPILPWLVLLGYAGMIMKRIIVERGDPFMPEWDRWNDMLAMGLKLFGVSFIYSLPAVGALVIGYFSMILLPAFMGVYDAGGESMQGMLLVMFASFALMMLGMVLSLCLWVILPPAICHTVAKDSFAAGFHIRDWWGVFRANLGGFFVTIILAGGLYMVMMIAVQILYFTIVLCILLPFLMAFVYAYLTIVSFTLFARAYREGMEKLEAQSG
jgi:hypothetical protein